MGFPAENIQNFSSDFVSAEIIDVEDNKYRLKTVSGIVEAGLALSCLVKPEPGDCVKITADTNSEYYILFILTRPGNKNRQMTLSFNTDVNLEVKNGGLQVLSKKNISLNAQQKIDMTSSEHNVTSNQTNIITERLSFLGKKVSSQIEKMKHVCSEIDCFFDRIVQNIKTSFRYVDEHDEVQTGSSRHLVNETLTVQSKNTIHLAEEQLKMDAEQIHLG